MYDSITAQPPRRRRWWKILIILIVLAVLAGLGSVVYIRQWYSNNLKAISTSPEEVIVTIPTGSSVKEIAAILKQNNLIRSAEVFERYMSSSEKSSLIKAGTYRLSKHMDVPTIASHIIEGNVATDLVTVLPGRRLDQIRDAFIEAGFAAAEVDAALEPQQYADHPALTDKPPTASLEGYLYPESFQKTEETRVADIITQSLDEMQKRLTPDVRAGIAKQGLSLHEGITVASIIEREVDKPEERQVVAQIFLSRLKIGMPLGADATFFYAAALSNQPPTPDIDSPYNTRRYPGVPPGPISNVTETSLTSLANPAATDYLFFVSGDDGKTYYSRTEEEHVRLTREHCIELCKLPDTVPE